MPSNIHRRPKGPSTHPNSHRWDTTLTADLEYYDTGKRKSTLMTRKLANTQTSISFGNHKVSLRLQFRELGQMA